MPKPSHVEAKRVLRARIIAGTQVYRERGRLITRMPDQLQPPRYILAYLWESCPYETLEEAA